MIALLLLVLVFIRGGIGFLCKVSIYIDLGKVQPNGKLIVVPADVVQILIVFQLVLGLVVERRLPSAWPRRRAWRAVA